MALERIPADIKRDGGVARSSDPAMIKDVMGATTLPVMAKSRIGHFYESKILEALQVRPPVDLPLDLLEPLRD